MGWSPEVCSKQWDEVEPVIAVSEVPEGTGSL